ncbi:MAG: hypothetical protein ACLFN0_05790 [Thermovirgaceae bacterium]
MKRSVVLVFCLQVAGLLSLYWGIHGGGNRALLPGLAALLGSAVVVLAR